MNETLKRLIYFLAFVEGGGVMCVELCSAKLLSPYFGTSIYIWASVLGITLLSLMSGYYLGGYLSSKNSKRDLIYWMMLSSGCLVALCPFISNLVLPHTIQLNLLLGSVLSLLSFLFLPLLLFGSVSPLVINTLTENAKDSGRSSGTVYAISTLGGIFTTFFVGFYSLPQFGLRITLLSYGILVVATAIILFIYSKKFNPVILLILISTGSLYVFNQQLDKQEYIYKSEGILGEVKVIDEVLYSEKEQQNKSYRKLMVNNISQTIMDRKNPEKSYWDYVTMMVYNIRSYARNQKVLLLGMGGGTMLRLLENDGFDVDVVDIDGRMEYIAQKYFGVSKNQNIIIDDARHYIKTSPKKYDVIIYDLFNSETPPIHLMTQEAFSEIRTLLNKDGLLAINFYGFIEGANGRGARSIYKTIRNEGFNIKLMATEGKEAYRNLLFLCSTGNLSNKLDIKDIQIPPNTVDLEDAHLLTDEKPTLEHLYLKAALSWRTNYNRSNFAKMVFKK